MIGSLFCEVEGVLANTQPLRRAALDRALAEDGLMSADATLHLPDHVGYGTRETVRRALQHHEMAGDETAITLVAHRADRHFASLVHAGVSLAPGARELVELAAGRCRLAIVTSLDRRTVDSVLALAELDGAFEVIIAAEDVAAAKPAPDGHRKAIERLSRRRPLDTRAGIALEPGSAGARAAHAAGLRCVLVAPFQVENIVEADAMLASLVGQTPATLDALLSLEAAG
jgi:beta-phosphoglucomutase-like phosphatase (HAD superfamily)